MLIQLMPEQQNRKKWKQTRLPELFWFLQTVWISRSGYTRLTVQIPELMRYWVLMDIFAIPYKAMVLRLVEENKISYQKASGLLDISGEYIQKRIAVTGKAKRWSLEPVYTDHCMWHIRT